MNPGHIGGRLVEVLSLLHQPSFANSILKTAEKRLGHSRSKSAHCLLYNKPTEFGAVPQQNYQKGQKQNFHKRTGFIKECEFSLIISSFWTTVSKGYLYTIHNGLHNVTFTKIVSWLYTSLFYMLLGSKHAALRLACCCYRQEKMTLTLPPNPSKNCIVLGPLLTQSTKHASRSSYNCKHVPILASNNHYVIVKSNSKGQSNQSASYHSMINTILYK